MVLCVRFTTHADGAWAPDPVGELSNDGHRGYVPQESSFATLSRAA
jgi:hypothetical protein